MCIVTINLVYLINNETIYTKNPRYYVTHCFWLIIMRCIT